MGVAFLAGWLGVAASARAQYLPVAGSAEPAPGQPPAAAPPGDPAAAPGTPPAHPGLVPPGYPPHGFPGAPDCPPGAPSEILQPNSFSPTPWGSPRPHHFFMSGEYLLWWVKKRQIPPLVTSGQIEDLVPGGEGMRNTRPVLGPGSEDDPRSNGGRVRAWIWFDDCHCFGLDAGLFGFEQRTQVLSIGSLGGTADVALARPFINANTGSADADPIALPNIQGGGLVVEMPRNFYGAEFNLRFGQEVSALTTYKLNMLVGARFLSLDEELNVSEGIIEHSGEGREGNVWAIHDLFTTYNRFYGGQVGLEGEARWGPVVLTVAGKLAFGETHQSLKIDGNTLAFETPTRTLTYDPSRGLLAQPTNIGQHRQNDFGLVPEVSVNLAWDFNGYVQAFVGYNFLWWSDVLRPGDQIDTTINLQPLQAPGLTGVLARPAPLLSSTDFWAQGLSFGVQLSY
jgi:hypothetical protein